MALGAERSRVVSMILREAWLLALCGVAAGLAGALASGRFIGKLLYGVKAHDPATLAGAALVLMLVALAASWIPARRAAGIDPVRALRHE
jgi:ABC-type antimicrobial peptide transport system permease subunit